MIISNVVSKEKLRQVQLETLEFLKDCLISSFGPKGSTTTIFKDNMLTKYTKDGHSILSDIQMRGVIERSVKQDLEDITRYIVKTVGDGTTSAIILSYLIFKELMEMETTKSPYEIIEEFKTAVGVIKNDILLHKNLTTPDDIYNITLISTNGNIEVATNLKNIYQEYGMDVFVDVAVSNTTDNILKSYDGMTLSSGYSDTAYINNEKGTCELRNPRIYAFEDPIDTPEMISLFEKIILNNIFEPAMDQTQQMPIIPTVIMAPNISRDMGSYMDKIITAMYEYDKVNAKKIKPPFLIITNIYDADLYYDITRMCDCKVIRKYIDPKIQENDVKNGLAPTLETVVDFYGSCDMVVSDLSKSKFINPKLMFNEEGEHSVSFKTLVEFLENELTVAYQENEDVTVTGRLKRRINSLKANMVEYLVGGVSMSDRDSLRDLVEDAVLNCRSAAIDGFGFGANYEGFRASEHFKIKDKTGMFNLINRAYTELSIILYKTTMKDDLISTNMVKTSLVTGCPYNLKTKEFDGKVLCSIQTDIVVLDVISKIITLMFTTNQFLCPDYSSNSYLSK